MSDETNDGGLVFPNVISCGMTVRQLYAGLAMHAMLQNVQFRDAASREIAGWAQAQANAMIACEQKEGKS